MLDARCLDVRTLDVLKALLVASLSSFSGCASYEFCDLESLIKLK